MRGYGERTLGLKGRQTEERVRVGRALRGLPLLDGAFRDGELHWTAIRELTRIVVPETEEAWRDWAKGKGIRELEREVAARQAGDEPTSPPDPSLITHVLRWRVRAETKALCRELQAAIRAELGGGVDDDAVLHEIMRRALGGGDDGGRAPYQVAVSRCDTCKAHAIEAGGEMLPVDDVVVALVSCDAQHIGPVDPIPT